MSWRSESWPGSQHPRSPPAIRQRWRPGFWGSAVPRHVATGWGAMRTPAAALPSHPRRHRTSRPASLPPLQVPGVGGIHLLLADRGIHWFQTHARIHEGANLQVSAAACWQGSCHRTGHPPPPTRPAPASTCPPTCSPPRAISTIKPLPGAQPSHPHPHPSPPPPPPARPRPPPAASCTRQRAGSRCPTQTIMACRPRACTHLRLRWGSSTAARQTRQVRCCSRCHHPPAISLPPLRRRSLHALGSAPPISWQQLGAGRGLASHSQGLRILSP